MLGVFLVNEGVITRDEFFEVSALQAVRTDPIGKVALKERYLTISQVMTVLAEQATSGERFGEVAVRLEFLTNQALWRLLFLQMEQTPSFLELTVELGIFDEAKARDMARAFRMSNADIVTRQNAEQD